MQFVGRHSQHFLSSSVFISEQLLQRHHDGVGWPAGAADGGELPAPAAWHRSNTKGGSLSTNDTTISRSSLSGILSTNSWKKVKY